MRATARKLLRVVPESVQGFYADHCPLQAAGIAYRVLFSIVPLAIVLVSIFGLVLQDDQIRANVVDAIVDFLPVSSAGRNDVEKALSSIATPASAAGLVSLLVFGWAATGMMSSIRQGLETAMHVVYTRPTARGKLVDVVLVVGTGALVLLTALVTTLGGTVERFATSKGGVGAGTLAHLGARVLAFALVVAVVLLLYRFVPTRGIGFRDGLAGALVTAVLLDAHLARLRLRLQPGELAAASSTARSPSASSSSTRSTSTPRRSCSAPSSPPRGRGPSRPAPTFPCSPR